MRSLVAREPRHWLLVALALAASCTPSSSHPPFEIEDVVGPAITALESEIAREEAAAPPEPDETLHSLADLLAAPETPSAERAAAIEALAVIATPRAASMLAGAVERAAEPTLRAHAARALARVRQDHVVPRLLTRLAHETDAGALLESATTLARWSNFAGVKLLIARRNEAVPQDRALLDRRLAEIARAAGAPDAAVLARWWIEGDPEARLPPATPSVRHRLALWRCIDALASSDASDAHFALAQSAPWAVELLCRALHDARPEIRTGAAAVLRDMGARASSAGPALVTALDEPIVAPDAALALGWIAYPNGASELARRVDPQYELRLRIAAARALGPLNLALGVEPLLRAMDEREPLDLRHAAAHSLALLDRGADVADFLIERLARGESDASAAEASIAIWLERLVSPEAHETRERWNALANAADDGAAIAARQRARAELLRAARAQLAR